MYMSKAKGRQRFLHVLQSTAVLAAAPTFELAFGMLLPRDFQSHNGKFVLPPGLVRSPEALHGHLLAPSFVL